MQNKYSRAHFSKGFFLDDRILAIQAYEMMPQIPHQILQYSANRNSEGKTLGILTAIYQSAFRAVLLKQQGYM